MRHTDGAEPLRIATLYPGVVLDAGFGIYPEFAGAPFFYRSNDIYDADRLARSRGTSPTQVEAWLAANDVRAILVKDDPRLESGMVAYARSRNFVCNQVQMIGTRGTNEWQFLVHADLASGPGNCELPEEPLLPLAPPTIGKRYMSQAPLDRNAY